METVTIRTARPEDASALLEIYAYYVRNTAISFEWTVPTAAEFRGRVERTLQKYPYFAAEINGRIVGYAYAGPFKERAAYERCVELTIYLAPDVRGQGIGRKLYEAMETALREMGIVNLYACIASPETEDEYVTRQSEAFHAHMGYRTVGAFPDCGYKFGRWYRMIWMEKMLGDHPAELPPLRPFPEIDAGA